MEMSRRRHSDENDGEMHEFPLVLANELTVCMASFCVFPPVFQHDPPAVLSLVKKFTRTPLIGGRDRVFVSQSSYGGVCRNTGGHKNNGSSVVRLN